MITPHTTEPQTDPTRGLPKLTVDSPSEDVAAFCRRHQLDTAFQQAMQLAEATFSPMEHLEAEVRKDPATDDEWIVLRVVVRGDRVNVTDARKQYTTAWVASVPEAQRYLIRLSPDIL